jgi:alanyl-tRNA synthetase
MPTSAEIRPSSQVRKDFLDFFKSKRHTIVPSSSLMPDAPNLLFTNAGMNQFVPIFLGQTKCPYTPGRAADTQKCIRAGGKHNDLDDVGLDTYHHTFFEMLGNWSFGDYFKKEAIEWAWELVVERWKFPATRLYATVYKPGPGDPSEFDQEAYDHWARLFSAAGLDPKVHIVNGNKKDNFWMMGDTGPCGPCSELHVDLTPAGDTKGKLVNQGVAECIEIWNLVFIQFNANPDGTFSSLPARHVDTGMGFERVTSIIQGTKGFKDFANAKISNYETDIFRPIFDELEKLSSKKYGSTLPPADLSTINVQQSTDIAFRVIADHIRTLSFAIADGIQPGNTDRNYVLRRILRRAVRYGRTLGFHEPFFHKLVDVLADTMGDVFPETRARKKHVQEVIRTEEEAFNRTLDRGLEIFRDLVGEMNQWRQHAQNLYEALVASKGTHEDPQVIASIKRMQGIPPKFESRYANLLHERFVSSARDLAASCDLVTILEAENSLKVYSNIIIGAAAFVLYDTYGFPFDLTELLAREARKRILKEDFEKLMDEQRTRARSAQKKQVIELSGEYPPTKFVGFENLEVDCRVLDFVKQIRKDGGADDFAVVDISPLYAEMGGQVGDTGKLRVPSRGATIKVTDTVKLGNVYYLRLDPAEFAPLQYTQGGASVSVDGEPAHLSVDSSRRNAIQRHHTVTHLFHWALHEVVSKDATQKGSYVGPEKLTFDFNSGPLTPQQITDIEKLVNERILENADVSWIEVPYTDVKSRKDILQFFGDKYGDTVRVVQIGGRAGELNGYSMELCGGTHTRATGEIGLFRIVAESAIAAGVRRIEAVAGLEAYRKAADELHLIKSLAGKVNSPVGELEKKIEALLTHQKELEKQVKMAMQRNASNAASELLGRAQTVSGIPLITHNLGDADGDFLQAIADALKGRFKGVTVLGGCSDNAVTLVATVSPEFTAKVQAGKMIQAIAPVVGGKGGGKPDNARGGGKDASKLDEALAKVKSLVG